MDLFGGVVVSLHATANITRERGCSNLGSLHLRLSGIAHDDLETELVNADLGHFGKELRLLSANVPHMAGSYAHHGELDLRASRGDDISLVPCVATWQCFRLHSALPSPLEVQ